MHQKYKMPDAFVILMMMVVLCYLASFFVLPGFFNTPEQTNTVMLSQFSQIASPAPMALFGEGGTLGFFNVLFEGLVSGDKNGAAIGVIAFILITGGAFGVLMQTKAIDNGVMSLINNTQKIDWLFIPSLFIALA